MRRFDVAMESNLSMSLIKKDPSYSKHHRVNGLFMTQVLNFLDASAELTRNSLVNQMKYCLLT